MEEKRSVEHYKDHEIVSTAVPEAEGWHYTISIVSHKGDDSAVHTEKSAELYASDTAALQAAFSHARRLVDDIMD